jgi:hypothetical protein
MCVRADQGLANSGHQNPSGAGMQWADKMTAVSHTLRFRDRAVLTVSLRNTFIFVTKWPHHSTIEYRKFS